MIAPVADRDWQRFTRRERLSRFAVYLLSVMAVIS